MSHEGIAESQYHSCWKEFLEVGKKRLVGDAMRQTTSNEVKSLPGASDLKAALAEKKILENWLLNKRMIEDGGSEE